MKTRIILAMIVVLSLGTSGYYTHASATNILTAQPCCGGDPGAPVPLPIPNPIPTPKPPAR